MLSGDVARLQYCRGCVLSRMQYQLKLMPSCVLMQPRIVWPGPGEGVQEFPGAEHATSGVKESQQSPQPATVGQP